MAFLPRALPLLIVASGTVGVAVFGVSPDTVRFDAEDAREIVFESAAVRVKLQPATAGVLAVTSRPDDPMQPRVTACDGSPIVSLPRHWELEADLSGPMGVTITIAFDPAEIPPPVAERALRLYRYDENRRGWTVAPGSVDLGAHTATARFPNVPSLVVLGLARPCPPTGLRVR